jgi:hypothetical protein
VRKDIKKARYKSNSYERVDMNGESFVRRQSTLLETSMDDTGGGGGGGYYDYENNNDTNNKSDMTMMNRIILPSPKNNFAVLEFSCGLKFRKLETMTILGHKGCAV